MTRLLLIEDDPHLARSLCQYLFQEGYPVMAVTRLDQAEEFIKKELPELILLDWMLPDGQGIDFLRKLRDQGKTLPVILLTAKADLVDKVLGLETGAHDYLTKPFEPRELLARIRVQLRSPKSESKGVMAPQLLNAGPIGLDLSARTVSIRGTQVVLTKMEFELLKLLCENPNRAFSREELLNRVWGFNHFPTTRTVDTHILQLRTKCGDEFIETLRGVGYRLKI